MIAKKIGFKRSEDKDSLYFAARKKDVSFLKEEFKFRSDAGFRVQFLDQEDILKNYGLKSEGAILSHHGARTDAYAFTHALFQYSIAKGLKVYDRTEIKSIKESEGNTTLKTLNGFTINAKKVINASGYEVVNFIKKKIVKLHSTYAVISDHLDKREPDLRDDVLFWNTDDPYLYFTTVDGRIMIGGRDENFYNPHKRDKLIGSKCRQLVGDFKKMFPDVSFQPEFSWAGTFGATKDGLPFIGKNVSTSNTYYALGFGGNGITFSLIAAEIITDLLKGKGNADSSLFAFDR
jgi:glycine/D-amino acid oxidase-like deaminating enzyme